MLSAEALQRSLEKLSLDMEERGDLDDADEDEDLSLAVKANYSNRIQRVSFLEEEEEEEGPPLAGPHAPFWPQNDINSDPLMKRILRRKHRATVETQTYCHELVRIEDLEEELAMVKRELEMTSQALKDLKIGYEMEKQSSMETEMETAGRKAMERLKWQQQQFDSKLEQRRAAEKCRVSNIEGTLKQEKEEAVRLALEDAQSRHAQVKQQLEQELQVEKTKNSQLNYKLDKLQEAYDLLKPESETYNDSMNSLAVLKDQMAAALEEKTKLRSELDTLQNRVVMKNGELANAKAKLENVVETMELEQKLHLEEVERVKESQENLRGPIQDKLSRVEEQLRVTQRRLEHTRGDYQRDRKVNEMISARQLEILGKLKRENKEMYDNMRRLEQKTLGRPKGRSNQSEDLPLTHTQTHDPEQWFDRGNSTLEEVLTRGPRKQFHGPPTEGGGGGGDKLERQKLPRVRFASGRTQRTNLVPGAANVLKVQDSKRSMQNVTGIISEYQRYIEELSNSVDIHLQTNPLSSQK